MLLIAAVPAPDRSIADVEKALAAGETTAARLTHDYLARIEALNHAGPQLNAVTAVNPEAVQAAAARDAEQAQGRPTGALHGVPILIKDNIETRDPVPTTAGSLALASNLTRRDAPAVARLRAAGAIILGKTNLSEWANMRSPTSTSGWSAVGGLTRNPYMLDRSACGSSSGTAAAIAAGLAVAGVGTETDGSITCPASANGLVGLKPTVGLISRTHVVPISHSQDTPGPIATSMADLAALLTVMAGSDPADPATAEADAKRTDYSRALVPGALKGARIGVLRFAVGEEPGTVARFEQALAELRAAGAILVDINDDPARNTSLGDKELLVLLRELKVDLNAYLATTAPGVATRDIAAVVAFNKANAVQEMPWFGQEFLEQAAANPGYDAAYGQALADARRIAGPQGIDRMLTANRLDALVAPTGGPAWRSDLIAGDHFVGGGAGNLPAIAGYPHLTVPMGMVHGLPVGLSIIGPKWSEARLIGFGYDFEQRTHHRQPPAFLAAPEAADPVNQGQPLR